MRIHVTPCREMYLLQGDHWVALQQGGLYVMEHRLIHHPWYQRFLRPVSKHF